jgi:murein DD-endopeptidase MepM/ murein hydrolase activator NlpD
VKVGDQVRQGQPVATAGASGRVSEPQVHFQLRKGKTPIDPSTQLTKAAG